MFAVRRLAKTPDHAPTAIDRPGDLGWTYACAAAGMKAAHAGDGWL
ncbi:hypothetical protein [Paraburkholderia graminis]|nr:hypothetical protein [Paraburkholderia graminis]